WDLVKSVCVGVKARSVRRVVVRVGFYGGGDNSRVFQIFFFGLVSIRSGGAWCLGWTLPVCFCQSSAQSPLLVIAGGFFLCSQRQTRGSSVSLGARWYL
ncbi:unnamed protein product, partial [Brassica oleracea var. botrytis]